MGKFCSKCGKEDKSNSNYCQFCGNKMNEAVEVTTVEVDDAPAKPNNGMAVAGFILSFFVPLLGLIFSIIGVVKSKNLDGAGKGLAIAGIIISAVSMVASTFIFSGIIAEIIESAAYYY